MGCASECKYGVLHSTWKRGRLHGARGRELFLHFSFRVVYCRPAFNDVQQFGDVGNAVAGRIWFRAAVADGDDGSYDINGSAPGATHRGPARTSGRPGAKNTVPAGGDVPAGIERSDLP